METPRRFHPLRQPVALAVLALTTFGGGLLVANQVVEDVQILQGPGGRPVPRDVGAGRGPGAPQPPGTAVVAGVVVSADGGRPIRRATVRLASTLPGTEFSAVTDDQGRFQLEKVSAGRYTLTASKPGFLDSTYGQRKPGNGRPGTPLSLVDGQRVDRLSLPIVRGNVLTGIVVDDVGEPAFGTDVRAFKYEWQGGERVLRLAGTDKADDRGSYRIAALLPGDYVVMAGGEGSQLLDLMMPKVSRAGGGNFLAFAPEPNTGADESAGYAPVYFPNVRAGRDATTITLEAGEERTGVDFQLPLVPFGRITGTVAGESGQPVAATEIRLVNADDPLPGLGVRSTVAAPDGQFSFRNVPSGRYRLIAHSGPRQTVIVDQVGGEERVQMQFMSAAPRGGPGSPFPGGGGARIGPGFDLQNQPAPLWATAEVTVTGRDSDAVSLTMRRGMTVSGQIQFDSTGQPPADLTAIRLVLNSTGRNEGGIQSAMGQATQDGSFTITNVTPGTYRVSVLGTPGWRPKTFDVLGRDALDFQLDVEADRPVTNGVLTLTTRTATLTGIVRDSSGQPASAYTIIVFADDAGYWTPQSRRIQATRPATDGRFSVGNLPAGRYRLAALEDLEDGQWFDPAFLKQVSGAAIPIAIGDGETRTQDIRVK